MYRTQCTLALIALFVGLAHSFSWDIVLGRGNYLEFYKNNGTLAYDEKVSSRIVNWLAYDSLHNRVLFSEMYSGVDGAFIYDIATNKTESIIKLKPNQILKLKAYDLATELLFGTIEKNLYSFSLKPGSNNDNGNLVISFQRDTWPRDIAVDSCRGYIYWTAFSYIIERARFNGSEREVIIDNSKFKIRDSLTIDQQTQKMYWIETEDYDGNEFSFESADLNGMNRNTIYSENDTDNHVPEHLTTSKDFIYWGNKVKTVFWLSPKNSSHSKDMEPKQMSLNKTTNKWGFRGLAANYPIEEQIQGIKYCKALKCLLPKYSETNDCKPLNDSTHQSLLCVHGTQVTGESRCECAQGYIGDRCDISVCQNYCFRGNCSTTAKGQPSCRCNAGHSGTRCEINECHEYCLNNGVCTLNKDSDPVCQCTGDYEGERCEFPVILIKCFQTVSMLKDVFNTDTKSVSQKKLLKSTCASTVV